MDDRRLKLPTTLSALIVFLAFTRMATAAAFCGYTIAEINAYPVKKGAVASHTLPPGCILIPGKLSPDLFGGMIAIAGVGHAYFDFKVDKAGSGRTPVLYLGPGEKWTSGFIDLGKGYDLFSYETGTFTYQNVTIPTSDMDQIMSGLQLMLDKKAYADFVPPVINNVFYIPKTFEVIWPGLIETLAEAQIPIETLEKDSGILVTGVFSDPIGETMECATALDQRGAVRFNIFARSAGDSTKVVVNSTFTANRNDEVITCYSNGTIEEWLISKVR